MQPPPFEMFHWNFMCQSYVCKLCDDLLMKVVIGLFCKKWDLLSLKKHPTVFTNVWIYSYSSFVLISDVNCVNVMEYKMLHI